MPISFSLKVTGIRKKRVNFAPVENVAEEMGGFPPGLVLARSYNDSNTNGGVAYANANNDPSNTNSNYGSRLIFRKRKYFITAIGPDVFPIPTVEE